MPCQRKTNSSNIFLEWVPEGGAHRWRTGGAQVAHRWRTGDREGDREGAKVTAKVTAKVPRRWKNHLCGSFGAVCCRLVTDDKKVEKHHGGP